MRIEIFENVSSSFGPIDITDGFVGYLVSIAKLLNRDEDGNGTKWLAGLVSVQNPAVWKDEYLAALPLQHL